MISKRIGYRVFKAVTLDFQQVGRELKRIISRKKRRFQVYCVGLPRSGTHSVTNLFRSNFRADHEPFAGATVKVIESLYQNRIDSSKIKNHLVIRDNILQLEIESAHYLHQFVPELVTIFPDSKFILTVREPKSWLESEMNKNFKSKKGGIWSRLETVRYGRYNNKYESDALKGIQGVYPISSYLQYYTDHIKFVLNHVPEDRLLILDTFALKENIDLISDFTSADSRELNVKKIHSAKRRTKEFQLDRLIEETLVQESIDKYCRSFIEDNVPFLLKHMDW